jgi:hypothetical protein
VPELAYWFMYPVALGSMAGVGVGLFLFFSKAGCFD